MKFKSTLTVLMLTLFSFSYYPLPTKSVQTPNLEIVDVKGISEEVGSFRYLDTIFFTQRNFYKQGMAFDSRGNLYITDSGDCQIEVFDENLKPLRHFGSIGTRDGQFQYLVDLKIDEDQIFTLDLILGRIQVFDLEGKFLYQFETGTEEDSNTSCPTGFAISLHQNIFVMDLYNGLKIFNRKGEYIQSIEGELLDMFTPRGSIEQIINNFIGCEDMKSDEDGNIYIIINFGGDGSPMVIVLNSEGKLYGEDYNSVLRMSYYLSWNGCFALEGDYFYGSIWDDPSQNPYEGNVLGCFRVKYKINPDGIEQGEEGDLIFPKEESEDSYTNRIDLHSPTAFLVRNDTLYFLDSEDNKIIKMNLKGEIVASYISPKPSQDFLQGIYGNNLGKIFTTNVTKSQIEIRNNNLEITGSIGKKGNLGMLPDIGDLCGPYTTVIDTKGYLYCSDLSNGCIQVFDPEQKPFYTIYPLYRIESPTGLFFDNSGNLLLIDQLGRKIFVFDISNIQKKEVKLIKRIPIGKLVLKSLVVSEKNNFLIPITEGGILAEMNASGKIIKKWDNPLSLEKEEFYLPKAIWKDENQNYMLADEWQGYIWKFDSTLKSIWSEKLNWFGIKALWESNDGTIYVLDKVHGAILTIKDKTFEKILPATLVLEAYPETTYQDKFTIKGRTDPGNTVIIGDYNLAVDINGTFEKEFPLQMGENKWTIESFHSTRKKTTKEIRIVRLEKIVIKMKLGSSNISINAVPKVLEAPIFRDDKVNRIYAPVRILVETILGKIEWVAAEQKVIIRQGENELILVIGDPYAILNNKKIPIDPINEENKSVMVVPKILKGRLFLPLRFVSEQLGYQVEWIDTTQEIILTYPDPKRSSVVTLSQSESTKSFGKVLGVTLDDNNSTTFSLPNGETILFISSGMYGNTINTGVVILDQAGKIKRSQLIGAGFEKIIHLSNQKFLLINKERNRSIIDGLIFTWLDPEGQLIETKKFTFDYSHFYLPVILSARELDEQIFEVIISGSSRDESANLKDDSTLRLLFNTEGILNQIERLQFKSYYGVNAGNIGIAYPIWKETRDNVMSLCDYTGKTLWTKNFKLPKIEKKKDTTDLKSIWLSDNSLLVSMINKNEDLYLTRLDEAGKTIWETKISKKSKFQLVSLINAILLSNGDLIASVYLKEGEDVYSQPVLIIDKEGILKQTFEIDPEAHMYGSNFMEGSEGDIWLSGYTHNFAFGSSSALLFHFLVDDIGNTCYQTKFVFSSSRDALIVESLPNEKNLTFDLIKLKKSTSVKETTIKPALALTKNLCP